MHLAVLRRYSNKNLIFHCFCRYIWISSSSSLRGSFSKPCFSPRETVRLLKINEKISFAVLLKIVLFPEARGQVCDFEPSRRRGALQKHAFPHIENTKFLKSSKNSLGTIDIFSRVVGTLEFVTFGESSPVPPLQ